MVHILDKQNSLLNSFVAQMRSINIQGDSMRFRRNLERAGEIMAYEISKTMIYEERNVETPLGEAMMMIQSDDVVIATVLRAGIPFHQGFLNYFDGAGNAFVSAYRKYGKDNAFTIKIEYVSCCDLTDKILILVDPMIATGASVVLTYNALLEKGGIPKHTHVAAVISSEEGVDYVRQHTSSDKVTIWSGAVDAELTVKSFIVPGIGDVGDLAYGEKL